MPSESEPKFQKSAAPFNNHARVQVHTSAPATGHARIPDAVELKNHLNTVHGGALFTVGEASAAKAVLSVLGEDIAMLGALTKKAEIKYLKAARGEIDARATMLTTREEIFRQLNEHGRTSARVEVELMDQAGVTVAEMLVDWHVAKQKSKS
jgi:acyl-coenzyme A thioesterase PaaI-like protein